MPLWSCHEVIIFPINVLFFKMQWCMSLHFLTSYHHQWPWKILVFFNSSAIHRIFEFSSICSLYEWNLTRNTNIYQITSGNPLASLTIQCQNNTKLIHTSYFYFRLLHAIKELNHKIVFHVLSKFFIFSKNSINTKIEQSQRSVI